MILFTGLPHEIHVKEKSFFLFVDIDGSFPMQAIRQELSSQYGRNIKLDRITYKQYQQPFSDCSVLEDNTLISPLEDRSIFDLVVATGYAYTRKLCFMVCRQVLVTKTCGCNSYDSSYRLENFNVCGQEKNTLLSGGCMTRLNANSTLNNQYCFPRCPLECRRSFFNMAISEYTYDKNYFNKYLNTFEYKDDVPNGTDLVDYLNNNMVELWINYDTYSHIEINEEPEITSEELLGQLGGHLHLFLGMSLLSFVELFELLSFVFVSYFLR